MTVFPSQEASLTGEKVQLSYREFFFFLSSSCICPKDTNLSPFFFPPFLKRKVPLSHRLPSCKELLHWDSGELYEGEERGVPLALL